jgi:hypothetical protein
VTITETAEVVGALVAVLGFAFAVYAHLRNRGRLHIDASFTDSDGSLLVEIEQSPFLFIKATNYGHENIVLQTFVIEFRPPFPSVLFSGYIEIELFNQTEPVKLEPGERHFMLLPFVMWPFVLTAVSAKSTVGRQYGMDWTDMAALRWQQYREISKRRRLGDRRRSRKGNGPAEAEPP